MYKAGTFRAARSILKRGFTLDKKKKNSELAKKAYLASRGRKDLENFVAARIYENSVVNEGTAEYGGTTS